MFGWIRNDLGKIGFYLVVVIIVGAAFAPALYFVGKWAGAADLFGAGAWLDGILDRTNFQRFFNRAMLVAAVVCIWPLIRALRRGEWERGLGMGLERDEARWVHLVGGFLLAGSLLMLMGLVFLKTGVYEWREAAKRPSVGSIVQVALMAAAGAAVVEEFFFRGLLMGVSFRAAGKWVAMVFVTFVYTVVHFLKPPDSVVIPHAEVAWWTGFWLVGQIFVQFGNPLFVLAEFATLFAVGWVLGLARLWTGALWASIGLHAGWIFGLKFYSGMTKGAAPVAETLPWVGASLKEGLVPFVVVTLTGVVVWWWVGRKKPRMDADPSLLREQEL
ncbi:MAG: CPBP family glutamic-type intramembrane protease [Verrucomicrobiota bacterium]